MKKYEIELENGIFEEFTIEDLASLFRQMRGFPSILYLGAISGEGQSGGRIVTEIAKELERLIIEDIGVEEYTKLMDEVLK